MAGLYDDTPGLSDGTGLWRGRLGLFSGASGFINGSGGAYVDLYFSAGTYSVAGNGYTTLGSIPGFTFTRASLAMGYDATGKLTYGPNNLVQQSQTLDNASWSTNQVTVSANATAAPDGTTTADLVTESVALASHQVFQSVNPTSLPVVISVYAKPNGRSWVALQYTDAGAVARTAYFNISAGTVGTVGTGMTASITSVGNGWYRVAAQLATTVAGASNLRLLMAAVDGSTSYTGDGTSGIYLWGVQLEAVTYQTTPSTYYPTTTAAYYGPRLVYDPVTLASQGILVEEARTNLCLQSQTFDNATWTKAGVTVTANSVLSPDGTTNADTMVEAVGVGSHYVNQAITTTAAAHTFSAYIKAAGRTFVMLYYQGGNVAQVFDVANGTVGGNAGANAPTSAAIQSVGNGWYRCSMVVTTTAALNGFQVYACSDGSTYSYSGDGTSGLYLFGGQLELGQGASSPIPTTTASVTRAADVAAIGSLSIAYPLSIVSTFQRDWDAGTAQIVAQLDAGSNSDRTYIGVSAADAFTGQSAGGSAGGSSTASGTLNTTSAYVGALRALTDDFRACLSGTLAAADTSFGYPSTSTALRLGSQFGGNNSLNGTISRIRIYNRALSDAELQSITQSLLLQEDGYSILQEDNSYIWLE